MVPNSCCLIGTTGITGIDGQAAGSWRNHSHVDHQRLPARGWLPSTTASFWLRPLDPHIELAVRHDCRQLIADLDSFGKDRGGDRLKSDRHCVDRRLALEEQ